MLITLFIACQAFLSERRGYGFCWANRPWTKIFWKERMQYVFVQIFLRNASILWLTLSYATGNVQILCRWCKFCLGQLGKFPRLSRFFNSSRQIANKTFTNSRPNLGRLLLVLFKKFFLQIKEFELYWDAVFFTTGRGVLVERLFEFVMLECFETRSELRGNKMIWGQIAEGNKSRKNRESGILERRIIGENSIRQKEILYALGENSELMFFGN